MKRRIAGLLCLLVACSSVRIHAAEPVAAAGRQIDVLFDRGIGDGMSATHVRERNQIGEWMDKDLVRVFARYAKQGYTAELIGKADDFKPGQGRYLLKVGITEYSAGNKAARMLVGYGAGGMTLKCRYDLSADGKSAMLSDTNGVFSGRDWRNLCRKVNENIAKAVTEKLTPTK